MASIATVLIGNSDDKLTQQEWSNYIRAVQEILRNGRYTPHFQGFSSPTESWQNACWVIELLDEVWVNRLRVDLSMLAKTYRQDSIALVLGDTEFVSGRI